MKKFIGLFFIGGFLFFGYARAATIDVKINEVGAYATSSHEWVEIYNKGSESVDLNGWKFWENSTNHGLSVSTTDAVLAPGEYGVIAQDANQFLIDYPSFTGSVFDSSWSSLREEGELIGLKDGGLNLVEQFIYVAELVRKPVPNPQARKLTEKERFQLARLGALRVWTLKNNIRNMLRNHK